MKLFITKLFFCCSCIFICNIAIAQAKFYATATPSSAGIEEYITLKFTIENGKDIQSLNPTLTNDFIVVSGPNQESFTNSFNGNTTQSVSVSFILQPKKAGNFSIGSASAVIDGKIFKSNVVKISVSNKKSLHNNAAPVNQSPFGAFNLFEEPKPQKQFDDYIIKNGETVQDKVSKNMQLRLQTNKTSCYVGEPILATYKLYTRLRTESNMSKNPSFNGFSVIDMLDQLDQNPNKHESLNGREYNVYVIRKAQLYPLLAGVIELESATLENKITFVKNENGVNNMLQENVSLSSKPLTILVKSLPEKGKPENFKEAVGNFDIDAVVEKNNFSTDETGKLLITISGKGNMQLLTSPDIAWPTGFEVFETKITDNTNNATIPISGSKTYEFPFIVADSGSYIIPSIKFSFFDPSARAYKTITTKSITVNISKGNIKPLTTMVNIKKEKPISLLIKIFSSRWLVILFLTGIIIVAVIFWISKENKEEEKMKVEKLKEETIKNDIPVLLSSNINYLEKTESCLSKDDCLDFYMLLNTEIKQFLAKKFLVEKEKINSGSLIAIMDKHNIDNNIVLQTQQLMQEIEWQLYTPFEHTEILNEMYARAQTIIQMLNKPLV